MKNKLLYLLLFVSTLSYAQVGIGTTNPKAFFHVPGGHTVLFGDDSNYVNSSPKLIWYGSKGALRAGYIGNENWNSATVGYYSLASGYNTTASGYASAAYGLSSVASGYSSMAIGGSLTASGSYATAIGTNILASGYSSVGLGQSSTASGYTSRAIGYVTTASGDLSTAMGAYVSTNNKTGSFIIGDNNSDFSGGNYWNNTYTNTSDNQMIMRFKGGYVFYTTTGPQPQTGAIGAVLNPNQSAWQTLSDSTRKENFRFADGASFLQKIARMRLGSWNYKGQDAKLYRHYGPMAQDFFAAFGHDAVGTIGEDTSINQADFDGVNLIAIQALIRKVEKLEAENKALREENESARHETASIKSDLEQLKKHVGLLLKQ